MGYTRADTNPKVGFRPYLQTNPREAAILSGLDAEANWKLGQVRVFDPWILHGIGQVRPFDQHPGGWLLHGLGQEMPLTGFEDLPDPQEVMLQDLVAKGILTPADADGVRNGDTTIPDQLGVDPLDEGSWSNLLDLFSQTNDDLLNLEDQVRMDPSVAAAIGRDVIQARTRYTDLATQYIQLYGTVFGSTPTIPGLGYLGIAAVAWAAIAAGAAAAFFLISRGLEALQQYNAGLTDRAVQATKQAALAVAAKAQATGDVGTMREALKVAAGAGAGEQGKPQDWLVWLQQNAKWIALAGIGIVVAGPMTEGIFGSRRRR